MHRMFSGRCQEGAIAPSQDFGQQLPWWGAGGAAHGEVGVKVTFLLGWKENSWHLNFPVTEQLAGENLCVHGGGGGGRGLPSPPLPPSVRNNQGRSLYTLGK